MSIQNTGGPHADFSDAQTTTQYSIIKCLGKEVEEEKFGAVSRPKGEGGEVSKQPARSISIASMASAYKLPIVIVIVIVHDGWRERGERERQRARIVYLSQARST